MHYIWTAYTYKIQQPEILTGYGNVNLNFFYKSQVTLSIKFSKVKYNFKALYDI